MHLFPLLAFLLTGGRAMRSIKGPAIFLAQFAGGAPPFNNLKAIAGWAAGLGFKACRSPSGIPRRLASAQGPETRPTVTRVKGPWPKAASRSTKPQTHRKPSLV